MHSFGSTAVWVEMMSHVPPLDWAMYMFISQWPVPGTMRAGPPGPCAIEALSIAALVASRARSPLVAITAC